METKTMKKEMQDVLEKNILRFWLDKMIDRENGGFYGRIDGSGVLHPEAEKGAILNARILWTFSAAYRVFSHLSPLTSKNILMLPQGLRIILSNTLSILNTEASIGVSTTKATPSTPRNSFMPSASLCTDSRNMREPQATERLWSMRSTCMNALRSMHWIANITAISRPVRESGAR